ncbi:MAG: hypothetical protein KC592_06695 [Nitrospira sp.]|nr:hypothetical protein [Nitrospira sp.]
MQVSNDIFATGFSTISLAHVSIRTHAISQAPPPSLAATETEDELRLLRQHVISLKRALDSLKNPFPLSHRARVGGEQPQAATTSSSADLGLGSTPATATIRQSTEEVNTTPTSFSPFGPAFTGNSTSTATLSGVYDGDNGTDTLTFQVTNGGIVGVSPVLSLEVRNSQAQLVETISLTLYQPDDPFTLQNGLVLSLGSGSLTQNDTFTVAVSNSVGSAVNPDKPFNGTRNDNPNLEEGLGVSAGSFQVNGTTIDVFANDTINAVLTRINQSAAGVTATFDSDNETVVLTHNTLGASPIIALGSDTSGFLAATKLSGSSSVQGQDEIPDEEKPLGTLSQFSSVQSGSILLNSVAISIDVFSDSLQDVLTRITASAAGVTATLNAAGQRIILTSQDADQSLEVNSNGTGFFAAVGIAEDTYDPTVGTTAFIKSRQGLSPLQAKDIADTLQKMANSINSIFQFQKDNKVLGPSFANIQSNLKTAVSDSFHSGGPRFKSQAGINFNFEKGAKQVLELSLSGFSRDFLVAKLERNPSLANDLLFGRSSSNNKGLVDNLLAVATQTAKNLNARLGSTGVFVNVVV